MGGRRIRTEHGELLTISDQVLTPDTSQGEYTRITGFVVIPTRGAEAPQILAATQRFGPYTCDHLCLEITGLPEDQKP